MTTPLSEERLAEMRSRLSQTEPLYYCQLTGSEVHSLLDEVERQRQAMAWDDDLRDELHECCANLREYEAEVARLRARNAELEEQNGRLRAMVDNVVGQTAGTLMRAQDAERRIAERQGGHEWRRH